MPFKWPVKRRSKGKNAKEALKDDEDNGEKDNDGVDKEDNDNSEGYTAADVLSIEHEELAENVDDSGSKTNRRNTTHDAGLVHLSRSSSNPVFQTRRYSTPNGKTSENGAVDAAEEESEEDAERHEHINDVNDDGRSNLARMFCTEANDVSQRDVSSRRPTIVDMFCVDSPSPNNVTSVMTSQPRVSTTEHIKRQIRLNVSHIAQATTTPVRALRRKTTRNRVRSSPPSLQNPQPSSSGLSPSADTAGASQAMTQYDVTNTATSARGQPVVMNDLTVIDLDD